MLELPLIGSVAAALVGGGGLGAWLNHLRESRRTEVDVFERFYKIWQAEDDRRERRHQTEMAQLAAKVDHLEGVVVALSAELENAGVDPLRLRRCLHPPKKEPPT